MGKDKIYKYVRLCLYASYSGAFVCVHARIDDSKVEHSCNPSLPMLLNVKWEKTKRKS